MIQDLAIYICGNGGKVDVENGRATGRSEQTRKTEQGNSPGNSPHSNTKQRRSVSGMF